jgi:methionine-rich copper-binding protein CopC
LPAAIIAHDFVRRRFDRFRRFDVQTAHAAMSRATVSAAMIALLAFATPRASAHAIVVSARPAMNSTVTVGDLDVRMAFNSRIDGKRSRLALQAPDATVTPIELEPDAPPGVLIGRARTAAAGLWTLRWQVLSVDGHITQGEIKFFVRDAGAH